MKIIRISSNDIIFEDDNYIAIDKQIGWDMSQSLDKNKTNLFCAVKSFLKQRDRLTHDPYLSLHYKLAVKSSGVIIFGKTKLANNLLTELFNDQKVIIKQKQLHTYFLSFFDTITNKLIAIESLHESVKTEYKTDKTDKTDEKLYYIFNKPYNVLCQFTKQHESETALCDFGLPKKIYPVGRLDKDSEGLLLLTNDGKTINKIANADNDKEKTYLVQVDGLPDKSKIAQLKAGVTIKGGYKTKPCKAAILDQVDLPDRVPPIRTRKLIPTCWLKITITEGKNRQIRQMTAAVGHPTLRLIRVAIGKIRLPDDLAIGTFRQIDEKEVSF